MGTVTDDHAYVGVVVAVLGRPGPHGPGRDDDLRL